YPRKVVRIRRGVVQVRKVLLHTSSVTFGDSFSSRRSLGAVQNRKINCNLKSEGTNRAVMLDN
ncbi:MAG: hypothetical protein IKW50_06085, partial [Oscillospiraceae bacterium]|nr:hypothetical protein [Oscillospiraceae bacterium]